MPRVLRLVLAVIAGFIAGSVVNMALITISGSIIPPPAGTDVGTAEGLKAAIPLFEPKHFVMPFLAHFFGTLAGAVVAILLAPARTAGPGWTVGALFLAGGIAAAFMIPAPAWFIALDLVAAYLPAAWIAQRVASRRIVAPAPAF